MLMGKISEAQTALDAADAAIRYPRTARRILIALQTILSVESEDPEPHCEEQLRFILNTFESGNFPD
jgi:hypothetical protein